MLFCLVTASCARPVVVATPTATATSTPTAAATAPVQAAHAAEIRFALVGSVTSPNAWALFDSRGYSYNNYAVRSGYWPRLYRLTIPDGDFEPQAAAGMPSTVQQQGAFFKSSVPLRADLKWTDGSPFTAEDVAFTVNTALSFQLGFDWHAYYDPSWLDHAEAVDARTVTFFFKKVPDVAVWQYGALQGPVVQKAYWAPKLTSVAELLPPANLLLQIETLDTQVAKLQKSINGLVAAGATASGDEARQLQSQLQNQQRNLDGLRNDLSKAHDAVDGDMESARQSLYAIDAAGEPTLGTWTPAGHSDGTWTNSANPAHPFGSPNFDRAAYVVYPDEASAAAALKDGKVNAILEPNGISPALAAQGIPGTRLTSSQNASAEFLVINPASPVLQNPPLRRAVSCAGLRDNLAGSIGAVPLTASIPENNRTWFSSVPSQDNCGTDTNLSPRQKAVNLLADSGYTWTQTPSGNEPGQGLAAPESHQPLAPVDLLAPAEATDAVKYVQEAAQYLGLTVNVKIASAADIRFSLFNDHKYDLALVGWRLSLYPGYLCEWFGDGNPFGYNNSQVEAECAALSNTTDLEAARQLTSDIQSALADDPAFIPLFSGVTYDATNGLVYPFDHVLNGISGIYGAPDLAIPSSH